MTNARRLLTTLADEGVEVVFANAGTTEIPYVANLDAEPRLRPVLCLAEGVATVLTMAVALVLALVVPGAGLWPLLLLFLTPLVARVLPGDRRSP